MEILKRPVVIVGVVLGIIEIVWAEAEAFGKVPPAPIPIAVLSLVVAALFIYAGRTRK